MTLVDSLAAFEARCNEIDDSNQMFRLLSRQGLNTFSSLAFAIGTLTQPPNDAAFDQFAQRLYTVPSMGQVGKLRRLLFEAQTYVLAQLKLAVTGEPGSSSRNCLYLRNRHAWQTSRRGSMAWFWKVRRNLLIH